MMDDRASSDSDTLTKIIFSSIYIKAALLYALSTEIVDFFDDTIILLWNIFTK